MLNISRSNDTITT